MNAVAFGIDIGGTGTKMGLVKSNGETIVRSEIASPVDSSPEAGLLAIAEAATELIDSCGYESLRVGVGCAGLISTDRGIVHNSPNLSQWREFPLGERLGARLKRSVSVLNDANACALAEARFGAGAGNRR